MTSPVLFSTGAAPTSSSSRNLVEFKAGKMEMRDKMVHAIKREGLVYLHQSPDDNLMHFCWKDRKTGSVEDDLILFPDDCEFKRVKECTTGRVYVLKMKSSNKKMFFWMQESKEDRDEEFCQKINEMLNNPPQSGSDMVGGSNTERDLQALFGNMTQEQMATLLSSNGVNLASLLNHASHAQGRSSSSTNSTRSNANSSAPTSATSGRSAANLSSIRDGTPNVSDLRSFIEGSLMESNDEDAVMAASLAASQEASQTGGAGGGGQAQGPMIDLSTAINSESLAELLQDDQFLKVIEPHLPQISGNIETSDQRRTESASTIRSSQFRSSLSQFCVALQSGQLGPLMSQFGLNQACVDAANLGNLEAFVRALEAQFKGSSSESTATTSMDTTAITNPSDNSSASNQPSRDQTEKK